MEEKISIEFSKEGFDRILRFMDAMKASTVQDAILIAIDKQESTGTEGCKKTYYCSGCRETILNTDKYCAHCGRPINWYKGHMI